MHIRSSSLATQNNREVVNHQRLFFKKKREGRTRKHNMLMPLIANMHTVKRKFQAEVNYATIKQGDTVTLPPSY